MIRVHYDGSIGAFCEQDFARRPAREIPDELWAEYQAARERLSELEKKIFVHHPLIADSRL